jgi:hypothetical protein
MNTKNKVYFDAATAKCSDALNIASISNNLDNTARAASPAYSATAQKPNSMRQMTARDKIAGNTMDEPRSEGRDVTSSQGNVKICPVD